MRLAVTTKYRGNGSAAEVLLERDHPRVVPIGPIVRVVTAFPILGTWWDATAKVASQSFAGELWHFEYFPTTTVRQLLIFDHMTVTVVCCCRPNFIKIGSRVRPPDAHNCWMSRAPLLGNGRCHGNPISADMSGMLWDATSQVSSQ